MPAKISRPTMTLPSYCGPNILVLGTKFFICHQRKLGLSTSMSHMKSRPKMLKNKGVLNMISLTDLNILLRLLLPGKELLHDGELLKVVHARSTQFNGLSRHSGSNLEKMTPD